MIILNFYHHPHETLRQIFEFYICHSIHIYHEFAVLTVTGTYLFIIIKLVRFVLQLQSVALKFSSKVFFFRIIKKSHKLYLLQQPKVTSKIIFKIIHQNLLIVASIFINIVTNVFTPNPKKFVKITGIAILLS